MFTKGTLLLGYLVSGFIPLVEGRCHYQDPICDEDGLCCQVSNYCWGDAFGRSCETDMGLPSPSSAYTCVSGDCEDVNANENTIHCDAIALTRSSPSAKLCKEPPTSKPTPGPTPSPTPKPTPSPTASPTAAPTELSLIPLALVRHTFKEMCQDHEAVKGCLSKVDSVLDSLEEHSTLCPAEIAPEAPSLSKARLGMISSGQSSIIPGVVSRDISSSAILVILAFAVMGAVAVAIYLPSSLAARRSGYDNVPESLP